MATVSDTTNDPQPPQAGFQPEAETNIGTAFQMSGFQPSAQATTSSQYARTGTAPQIDNASSLPGAFFFITLTYMDNTKARVVAYDPWVQNGNSAASIEDYYKQNLPGSLPYYEIFSKIAANPWKYGEEYYSGTYAKDSSSKGQLSPIWYYSSGTSVIKNGVNIAFWNQKKGQAGLFTSSTNQRFDESSATTITSLYIGTGRNFIPSTSNILKGAQVDFYAMQGQLA